MAPDLEAQLAQFKTVPMPLPSRLTPRERQMIDKLVEAANYLEAIYWRQSDPEGLDLYRLLEGSKYPQDEQLRRLLFINGSRFNLMEGN